MSRLTIKAPLSSTLAQSLPGCSRHILIVMISEKHLQSLGADINTSISKKTNIVVIGDGAGPSKLRKIEELRESGCDIRIIYEPELIDILS